MMTMMTLMMVIIETGQSMMTMRIVMMICDDEFDDNMDGDHRNLLVLRYHIDLMMTIVMMILMTIDCDGD